MRTAIRVVTLTAFATFVAAAACGSSAASRGRRSCELRLADSVFARSGPVYRDCAVDRKAELRTRDIRPDFRPPATREGCHSATVEFVVDTAGRVELSTARVARSNDPAFASSLLRALPMYRYEPARLGGIPVRQIATDQQAIVIRRVVAVAGSLPPPTPSGGPGC